VENFKPLVSVIIPAFNSNDTINATISSVLNQSYENTEIIIIDDCGEQRTIDVLEKDILNRIKLIRHDSNLGAASARNTGLREAKGRFIAFLDADDMWYSEKLARQIDFMQINKIAISHTLYSELEGDRITKNSFSPSVLKHQDLLRANYIGCLTVVVDREVVGSFEFPDMRRRQDYALWLKLSKKFDLILLPEILGIYRKDTLNSLSKNRLKVMAGFYSVYRHLGYSGIFSVFLVIQYICYYIIKRTKYDTISS
jgi:teichuronic acid biosynthesis glycosyltransferase TuaG